MFKVEIISENYVFGKGSFYKTLEEANNWSNNVLQKVSKLYPEENFVIDGPYDLNQDISWLQNEVRKKRANEYPNINDLVEALVEHIKENHPEKLNQLQAEREAIKIKYPKP